MTVDDDGREGGDAVQPGHRGPVASGGVRPGPIRAPSSCGGVPMPTLLGVVKARRGSGGSGGAGPAGADISAEGSGQYDGADDGSQGHGVSAAFGGDGGGSGGAGCCSNKAQVLDAAAGGASSGDGCGGVSDLGRREDGATADDSGVPTAPTPGARR